MDFLDYVPPRLLRNANAYKFVTVLDGLNQYKQEQLYIMDIAFNQRINFKHAARFLFENGQLPYLPELPAWMLVRFVENAYDIFDLKGTEDGLDLFALSVCDGVVENVDFSKWWAPRMLILDDLNYGLLPNGVDLVTPESNVNYLFADSFSFFYGRVSFDIKGDYLTLPETRRMIMELLIDLLCMVHPGTTSITIGFYTKADVLLETLNY